MATLVDKPNSRQESAPVRQQGQTDWLRTRRGSVSSEYTRTYSSYSGHDMVAIFEIPLEKGSITHVVGELQTISYSMYNEKMPVRVLGDMNMKSVVFGNRTIAGSMVFTVFDRHWAHKMMDEYLAAVGSNAHILTDELPPINITISMASEYGDKSRLAIYGVTFVMEGQTMSIEDMYTENTFQYMAKDLDYLTVNVDVNGGAKDGQNPIGKVSRSSGAADDTPVDLCVVETFNTGTGTTTTAPDYSQSFRLSQDDIVKGRDYCLSKLEKEYNNKLDTLASLYNSGDITKGQFIEWGAALKKAWQNARNETDKKFAKT